MPLKSWLVARKFNYRKPGLPAMDGYRKRTINRIQWFRLSLGLLLKPAMELQGHPPVDFHRARSSLDQLPAKGPPPCHA